MKVSAIAMIVNNEGNTVGFRLLDIDNGDVRDVQYDLLANVLYNKKMVVDNLAVYDNNYSFLKKKPKKFKLRLDGRYYTLRMLPFIDASTGAIYHYTKPLALYNINNEEIIAASPDGKFKKIKYSPNSVVNTRGNEVACPTIMNIDITSPKINTIKQEETHIKQEETHIKQEETHIKKEENNNFEDNNIWNMKNFFEYMFKNNFEFNIIAESKCGVQTLIENPLDYEKYLADKCILMLSGIDDKCKYVKIPMEISKISYIYKNAPKDPITLIIPPSVEYLNKLCLYGELDIERLHFQKLDTVGKSRSIAYMNISNCRIKDYNMPYYTDIKCLFNNCQLNRLDIPEYLYSVSNCFCNLKTNNDSIDTGNIFVIRGSFNYSETINKVVIGSKAIHIQNSFNYLALKDLNFVSNSYTDSIDKSFNMCNLTTLDLEKCKNLTLIRNSFRSEKLQNLKLNRELENLIGLNFNKCIEIPVYEKIKNINVNSEICNVTYKGSIYNSKISKLSVGMPDKFLDYSTIKILENEPTLNNITTYYNVEEIRKNGIADLVGKEFNTNKLPKLHTLSEKSLNNTGFKQLIINDNIRILKSNLFYDKYYVEEIIISDKITKINPKAFYVLNNKKLNATFYVIENSLAHKYLESNGFEYKLISDINNYRDTMDTRKQNKFKLLLMNSPEYEFITKPKYEGFMDKLYEFTRKVDNMMNSNNIILDRSKFLRFPINNLNNNLINKVAFDKGLLYYQSSSNYIEDCELSVEFKSMCNLITRITKPYPELLTLPENTGIRPDGSSYISSYKPITYNISNKEPLGFFLSLQVRVYNKYVMLLYIVIGNEIVYVTVFNNDVINDLSYRNIYPIRKEYHASLLSFLEEGDKYNYGSESLTYKDSYMELDTPDLLKIFKGNNRVFLDGSGAWNSLIKIKVIESIPIISARSKQYKASMVQLCYDVYRERFLILQIDLSLVKSESIKKHFSIESVKIIKDIPLIEIESYKDYLNDFLNVVNPKDQIGAVNQLILGNNETSIRKTGKVLIQNNYLLRLAKNLSMQKFTEASIRNELFEEMFEAGLISKFTSSVAELKDKFTKNTQINEMTNNKIYIKILLENPDEQYGFRYYFFLIDKTTPSNDNITVYASLDDPLELMYNLIDINSRRSKITKKVECYGLKRGEVNKDDYLIVTSNFNLQLYKHTKYGEDIAKFKLGIHYYTGIIYILVEINGKLYEVAMISHLAYFRPFLVDSLDMHGDTGYLNRFYSHLPEMERYFIAERRDTVLKSLELEEYPKTLMELECNEKLNKAGKIVVIKELLLGGANNNYVQGLISEKVYKNIIKQPENKL